MAECAGTIIGCSLDVEKDREEEAGESCSHSLLRFFVVCVLRSEKANDESIELIETERKIAALIAKYMKRHFGTRGKSEKAKQTHNTRSQLTQTCLWPRQQQNYDALLSS